MATIDINSWREFIGGTAWDANIKTELRKRLRAGVAQSQHELRVLARKIEARETVAL